MNLQAKKIIVQKLDQLQNSPFRAHFHLKAKEITYIDQKGLAEICQHAKDFINQKLAPSNPQNDGAQTPMKNHPVFIAQHATATCCRSCLEKWHKIKKDHELTEHEKNYIVTLIMAWIKKEYYKYKEE